MALAKKECILFPSSLLVHEEVPDVSVVQSSPGTHQSSSGLRVNGFALTFPAVGSSVDGQLTPFADN